MSRTIVKQPNGRYAVWSTIVDDFIVTNMSKKKLKKFFVAEAIKKASKTFEEDIKDLDKGYPISYYTEMVESIYSKEEYQKFIEEITSE